MNWITFLTFIAVLLSCAAIGLAVQNRKLRRHCEGQIKNLWVQLGEESDKRARLSAELDIHKTQIRELRRELKLHQVIDGEKIIFRDLATHHASAEDGENQERYSKLVYTRISHQPRGVGVKSQRECNNHKTFSGLSRCPRPQQSVTRRATNLAA